MLDEDSVLGEKALQKMLGALEHPLCRAVMSAGNKGVSAGHALAVPNMIPVGGNGSWLLRSYFVSEYCDAVLTQEDLRDTNQRASHMSLASARDVIYEAFGERHHIGKGVYSVGSAALVNDNLPQERLLSHDTIEGANLRPLFVGDALIGESFPDSYAQYCMRHHRWVRGDWQNLWLLVASKLRGPNFGNISRRGFLLLVVFDQVRRTLVTASLGIALALTVWIDSPIWICIILLSLSGVQFLRESLAVIVSTSRGLRSNVGARWTASTKQLVRTTFVRTLSAPHISLLTIDAAVRATLRTITKQRLLDWTPSSVSDFRGRLPPYLLVSALASVVALAAVSIGRSAESIPCKVLLLGWVLFPAIATIKGQISPGPQCA
jgi:cyclic beta-1,2-glucan synthetase